MIKNRAVSCCCTPPYDTERNSILKNGTVFHDTERNSILRTEQHFAVAHHRMIQNGTIFYGYITPQESTALKTQCKSKQNRNTM